MLKQILNNREKRLSATAVTLILVLAISTFALTISTANAETTINLSTAYFLPFIGENSPTAITWRPSPNLLMDDPAYEGKTSIWPTGTLTFTRPDGTTDIINGPFNVKVTNVQGEESEIQIIYTPNMQGTWTVNLYWPGDNTYNPVNRTDTFPVGPHYDKRDTWAMLSLKPYPKVGLGQNLLINAWVTPPPATNHLVYHDYLFTFTKPDGTSYQVGPMDSEAPGTVWFDLPLDQIGDWKIKFQFPGDFLSLPCEVTRTITVQQDPVQIGNPDTPLPTEEWTFPINVENREWRYIAGPWYQNDFNASLGSANEFTEAPRTAHVLWELEPYSGIGGFIGAPHSIETGGGEEVYGAGDAGIYSPSVPSINTIMAGRGYYTGNGNIYCIDMRTGEELWSVPGSFDVGTERSRDPVLYDFGSNFIVYDAISGEEILNVPGLSMAFYVDPYVYSVSGGRLIKWDTSGSSSNLASRIVWNVTNILPNTSRSHSLIADNLWIARHFQTGAPGNTIIVDYLTALNLDTGTMEYNVSTLNPANTDTWVYRQGPAIGTGFGKVFFAVIPFENEGKGYTAYDAKTGQLSWVSEAADYPWGNFWAYTPQCAAYGLCFGLSYSGVYAFNATNGQIVWHYIAPDPNYEEPYSSNIAPDGTPYASYSYGSTGPVAGGGLLFAPNTEHSPTFYYRNQSLHAIDVNTGEAVWTIKGIYTPTAIAFGVLVAQDSPNGVTYGFGKGTTQTTVSVSSKVISSGSPILIEGTVTDQSTAQKGTPAIADEYMTPWMEYLHMQQPMPTDAKGVQIHLTATDPNGNTQDIGTTTSTTKGNYKIMWTPPIEGAYTINAEFQGTEAYYGSTAETAFGVGPATAAPNVQPTPTPSTTTPTPIQTTPPPTSTSPSASPTSAVEPPTSATPTATYIAIAAAVVIIIVAATAIAIRKRKK